MSVSVTLVFIPLLMFEEDRTVQYFENYQGTVRFR